MVFVEGSFCVELICMNLSPTASRIESILFVSGDPVSVSRLAEVLRISEGEIGEAIDELEHSYRDASRGLSLLGKDGQILLSSHPEHAPFVERFLRIEREGPLSRASLETLSLVAYRGPVSQADVDSIRGVNSSMSLRNLLMRGLVERRENPDDARGYIYSVSFSFLESLGISHVSMLPQYESLSKDSRIPDASRVEANSDDAPLPSTTL